VAAALAVILIALVGLVLALIGQSGARAPSPTPIADASPSASPALAPSASPASSPSPAPSPVTSPAASPTAASSAVERTVTIVGLGLDRPGLEEAAERFISFDVDGPGRISVGIVHISSGQARVCAWRGVPTEVVNPQCQNMRSGALDLQETDTGNSTWTVSLIGADAQVSPTVTVQLRFSAGAGRLVLERLRFQGEAIENYNGFVVELMTSDNGVLAVSAVIDDGAGGVYPYTLRIEPLGSVVGGEPVEQSGHGGEVEAQVLVGGERGHRLTLENNLWVADAEVLLRAVISWP
jgi:hypothetical protein